MVTDGEKALGLVSIQQFLKVYVSRYTLVHMGERSTIKINRSAAIWSKFPKKAKWKSAPNTKELCQKD